MQRPLLLIEDIAIRFSVSSDTVSGWITAGELVAIRITRKLIRIDPDDLSAFEQRHKTDNRREA